MRSRSFTASRVTTIIDELQATASEGTTDWDASWLSAVVARCTSLRPDLGTVFTDFAGVEAATENPLADLSIAEIGMIYEALLAGKDRNSRKAKGQYFTPDDAANFMAQQQASFPAHSRWLDPCCGVGNLAWHLCAQSAEPAVLVKDFLILVDQDETALKTAVCLITADFAAPRDKQALTSLWNRSHCGNFLDIALDIETDFAIVNPPYASTTLDQRFRSASARDLYAYFLERLAQITRGFISVTPASFLTAAKFGTFRVLLDESFCSGQVFVFDNVPDTLFRGYKFGSTNTSKTNFARATIMTVHKEGVGKQDLGWAVTPILRWKSTHRGLLFEHAAEFLTPRRLGPHGEWAKIMPETSELFARLSTEQHTVADFLSTTTTQFELTVASTPRYFTSATIRELARGSKHTLFFKDEDSFRRGYILLNSSLLYWWWRCLDGGITLTAPKLQSLPLPGFPLDKKADHLIELLKASERDNLVTKLNAGKVNENVKHPESLVQEIDQFILQSLNLKEPVNFSRVFSPNLFASYSRAES